jgi:hypothetical protein
MAQQHSFAILQLAPSGARGERLNVATLVFGDDGIDVRIPKRLEKVRALSAGLNPDSVRELISNLSTLDALSVKHGPISTAQRIANLCDFGPFAFSEQGTFIAHSTVEYEARIAKILSTLVEPELAPIKVKPKRSRLLSVLKTRFRKERVLAKKGEELESHRVVSNWRLAEGLVADLLLKNGAMHVVETVDFSADDASVRKAVSDVAVSALVLEQARITYGQDQTKSRLVYDASAALEDIIMPSLDAAAHQGTELVNWASQEQRERFVEGMASLATPFEDPKKKKQTHFIASAQQRLLLN